MKLYWHTTIQCARCKKVEPCSQPGNQPPGWVVVAYTEKKIDLKQPTAPPQILLVPYPFCGPVCTALYALTRAWAGLATKDEKEGFMESLRKIKWWGEVEDDHGTDEEVN